MVSGAQNSLETSLAQKRLEIVLKIFDQSIGIAQLSVPNP
jgi:hypothetical protein